MVSPDEFKEIDPSDLVRNFSEATELVMRAYFNVDAYAGVVIQNQIHRELKVIEEQFPALGSLRKDHDKLLRRPEEWPEDINRRDIDHSSQLPGFNRGVLVTILAFGRTLGVNQQVIDVETLE